MKIACLANMNNMMFVLCRYLRDTGLDAHLLTLSDEPIHFSPASDTYSNEYLNFFSVLPYTKSTIYTKEAVANIKAELDGFDFYIGTDIAPALLALIGKKLDVFIPHGSEVYTFPFETVRPAKINKVWWHREKDTLRKFHLMGIKHTSVILFPEEYNIRFQFKDKLETDATYYDTSGPMVYSPQYKNINEISSVAALPSFDFFNELRAKNDLLVFSHSRHNGFSQDSTVILYQKGNDILIKGFATFIKNHQNISAKLILFEYGRNVEASKTLIKTLRIEENVVWMPIMPRNEIMFGLNISDLACGHFKTSWLTCGVVNETLASNKPLLHNRNDALYKDEYPTLYPVLNVQSAEHVTQWLTSYVKNPAKYKKNASKSSDWLFEYTVQYPLQIINEAIQNKALESTDLSDTEKLKGKLLLKNHRRKDKRLRFIAKVQNYFH
ncbi:MAG: hypothetical protein ABJG68_05655 [Crocinitomicaceae bacterium]